MKTDPPRDIAIYPIRTRQRRIYILPTRQGLLFMAVLGAMLLGSLNENNNLGFLMTFLLGGLLFVSLIHTYRNLSAMEILSAVAAPVFAGGTAIFDICVRADGWRRNAVAFSLSGDQTAVSDLNAGEETRIRLQVRTRHRGVLRTDPLAISTRFPLGLFRAWTRIRLPATGLVYPPPLAGPPATGTASAQDRDSGKGGRRQAGVDDFYGFRTYQPGDVPRHIAWKAFSRGQGLFTKVFAAKSGTIQIFDWNRVSEGDPEKRISILCHHILQAERHHMAYGLRLKETMIQAGTGPAHRHRCLKALALFDVSR
jgi:uncharacterized protein (DUF58 family)